MEVLLDFGTEISSRRRGVAFPPNYATSDPFRYRMTRGDDAHDGKYADFRQCGRAVLTHSFFPERPD